VFPVVFPVGAKVGTPQALNVARLSAITSDLFPLFPVVPTDTGNTGNKAEEPMSPPVSAASRESGGPEEASSGPPHEETVRGHETRNTFYLPQLCKLHKLRCKQRFYTPESRSAALHFSTLYDFA